MNNCNCNWLQKFKILSDCNCNWLQLVATGRNLTQLQPVETGYNRLQPVFLGAENELPCPGVLYYKKNQVKQPKGQ